MAAASRRSESGRPRGGAPTDGDESSRRQTRFDLSAAGNGAPRRRTSVALNSGLSPLVLERRAPRHLRDWRSRGPPGAVSGRTKALLFREISAASTSDSPRCAPCSAGFACLMRSAAADLPCADTRSAGRGHAAGEAEDEPGRQFAGPHGAASGAVLAILSGSKHKVARADVVTGGDRIAATEREHASRPRRPAEALRVAKPFQGGSDAGEIIDASCGRAAAGAACWGSGSGRASKQPAPPGPVWLPRTNSGPVGSADLVAAFVRFQQRRCTVRRATPSLLCSTTERPGGRGSRCSSWAIAAANAIEESACCTRKTWGAS